MNPQTDRPDRLMKILGLAAGIIVGAMLLIIGRVLFSSGKMPLYQVTPDVWAQNNYTPASLIVLLVSVTSAVIWYLIAINWRVTFQAERDTLRATLLWLTLFFPPILSVITTVWIWGKDGDSSLAGASAIVFLAVLLLSTFFCYWLSTALSIPKLMIHVVPLADLFR